jgi:hypothetical protein
MSRVTMTVRYPSVTLPALRRAGLMAARAAVIVALGVGGTLVLLYTTGLATAIARYGLGPMALVPVGVWLGWLCRGVAWLLVGQGVGLRLSWLYAGSGPFVTTLVRPRRVIVVRALPVSIRPVLVATRRPALKLQFWLTAVWALVAMGACALLLWRTTPSPWREGLTAGVTLAMLIALLPYRHGRVTDLWILFRLPFLAERDITSLVIDDAVLELELAEEAGDLDRARTALGRLEARGGDPARLSHWRSVVLEMEGRYPEALAERRRGLRLDQDDNDRPWQLATLADLLLAAGDAGELPVFEWKPAAEAALAEAGRLLPESRMAGTRAYYCVLTGDYRRGARLARAGIRAAGSRIEAAEGWCTLAIARAGGWDSARAAEALDRARGLAPGWPRVALAERRVQALMPVPLS